VCGCLSCTRAQLFRRGPLLKRSVDCATDSTETNRGHDTYNISTFDLHDTYLPQYKRAFERARPYGVMCTAA
jgi:hypothetical protein